MGTCLGQEMRGKQSSESLNKNSQDKTELTVEEVFPTPLLRAIVRKQTFLVQYLLSNGADPNAKDHSIFTHTPILVAADIGDMEILQMLLDAGAHIEAKNDIGLTALMIATLEGNAKMLSFLLSKRANINARSDSGATALMIAARDGNMEIVNILLKAGADVNLATDAGVTALMGAADDSKIVKALLAAGAKTEAVDSHGWTAVCYAIQDKQSKKLASLISNGAKNNPQCKDK